MSLLAAAMVALILPGVPSLDLRHQMPSAQTPAIVEEAAQPDQPSSQASVDATPVDADAASVQAGKVALIEDRQTEIASAPNLITLGETNPGLQAETATFSSPGALLGQPLIVAAYRPNPPLEEKPVHKFWDRTNKIGFAVHGFSRVADAVQSCILLTRPGRREAWLPTKSCTGITIYSLSMIPAQIGTSYLMHRKGLHHLERWVPYFWAAPSAAGIAVSIKAW